MSASASSLPLSKSAQSEIDAKRDRSELKVSRVTNGYMVKQFPELYVYHDLEQVIEHVRKYLTEKQPHGNTSTRPT